MQLCRQIHSDAASGQSSGVNFVKQRLDGCTDMSSTQLTCTHSCEGVQCRHTEALLRCCNTTLKQLKAAIKPESGKRVQWVTNNVRGIIVIGLCSMGGVQACVGVAGVMVQVLQQQQQPFEFTVSHPHRIKQPCQAQR